MMLFLTSRSSDWQLVKFVVVFLVTGSYSHSVGHDLFYKHMVGLALD